jgi:hypothetical protein
MASFALLSLLFGWILGQFFKVLILVPAGGVAFLLVLAVSIAGSDAPLQIALKIIVINSMLPVGYILGQAVFYVPGIIRRMQKTRRQTMVRFHARHR